MKQIICLFTFLFFILWGSESQTSTIQNEYILKLSDTKSTAALDFFYEKSRSDKEILHGYKQGAFHVRLSEEDKAIFMKRYSMDIAYLEPNITFRINSVPVEQWALWNDFGTHIDAEKAWSITRGSPDVVVAVIDTGVDYNHYALMGNMWVNPRETMNGRDDSGNGLIDDVYGWNFAGNTNDPYDDNMHGTHCAGIIAANAYNVMGIAPNVKIMPLKFLNGDGSGSLADALKAIEYATENGAHIMSNSWGGGGYTQSMSDAIQYAKAKNIVFVAAAGNEYNNNDRRPSYPASYKIDNVISVAASTSKAGKAYFSNYGRQSVHLFAPGYDIFSTVPGDSTERLSGTSMACPYVSGVAALIKSEYPEASYQEIKSRIMDGVTYHSGLSGLTIANGLLNAYNSLN